MKRNDNGGTKESATSSKVKKNKGRGKVNLYKFMNCFQITHALKNINKKCLVLSF